MTIFLRILGQLFLILIGYAAATLAASAFIHAIFIGSAGFDGEEARWIAAGSFYVSVPVVALFVGYFAFLPAVVAIGIAEALGARDWLFHAIAGGLVGGSVVALFWYTSGSIALPPSTLGPDPMLRSPMVLLSLLAAGMVGGIAYWAVAGRLAGTWRPTSPAR